MSEISLASYARQHGRTPASARQMAARGGFRTARKEGRDWLIDDREPYPDRRRRMRETVTVEGMTATTADERKAMLRVEQARQYSHIGKYGATFSANWERIPQGLVDTLTPEQLGWIVDLLHDAYRDGQQHPEE